ncbi:hypothetical protein QQZ08_008331 [Neonectria magnoliae]|uniref:Major facilitator superfamily (MFS) profile domain-containing protein n=1 Tax=Neonectria magnoliae TaxID=2732573 RepID=A0ABR1HV01_9HYPO
MSLDSKSGVGDEGQEGARLDLMILPKCLHLCMPAIPLDVSRTRGSMMSNLLIVAILFPFLDMFAPLFIPTYAVSRGMEETLASYLVAIVNTASTFGRIIPDVLADKFRPFNMLSVTGLVNGVVIMCMNKVMTTAELVIYSVVFGFSSGMIISGGAAAAGSQLCGSLDGASD